MEPIFLHDWESDGIEGLKSDFDMQDADLQCVEILFASYSYENYSGDAFVLFRKDGKFYEVNGSHCSCYGLEGQWEPEEADLHELLHRATEGGLGKDDYSGNEFNTEIIELLNNLLSTQP